MFMLLVCQEWFWPEKYLFDKSSWCTQHYGWKLLFSIDPKLRKHCGSNHSNYIFYLYFLNIIVKCLGWHSKWTWWQFVVLYVFLQTSSLLSVNLFWTKWYQPLSIDCTIQIHFHKQRTFAIYYILLVKSGII